MWPEGNVCGDRIPGGFGILSDQIQGCSNLRGTGMEDIIWLKKQISVGWALNIKVSTTDGLLSTMKAQSECSHVMWLVRRSCRTQL